MPTGGPLEWSVRGYVEVALPRRRQIDQQHAEELGHDPCLSGRADREMGDFGVEISDTLLPTGGTLKHADGTAWMAFYASTMLAMALELAETGQTYEDLASRFFEHFVEIVDSMNTLGGTGLWNEADGF